MALVTGTPLGSIISSEELYLEGAPYIYYQDDAADPLFNPDADDFYWGLSGTAVYPVYELGCVSDVNLSENLTMNDVLCDNIGVKSTIQQRNFIEFNFTFQQPFPLENLAPVLKGGAVTETSPTQKFGFGSIDQNQYYMVYCPKVYDTDAGDYIWIHLHKASFVDAFTINMTFGNPWQITGIKLRAFADTSKVSSQQFGMMGRSDLSVIP